MPKMALLNCEIPRYRFVLALSLCFDGDLHSLLRILVHAQVESAGFFRISQAYAPQKTIGWY